MGGCGGEFAGTPEGCPYEGERIIAGDHEGRPYEGVGG